MKDNVAQILEVYESQVELVRHWLSAGEFRADDAQTAVAERSELETDLRALEGNDLAEPPSSLNGFDASNSNPALPSRTVQTARPTSSS